MRRSISLLLFITFCGWTPLQTSAQLLKRIQQRAQQTVEDRAVNKAGEATEKGLDKAEDGVTGKNKKKATPATAEEKHENNQTAGKSNNTAEVTTLQVYSKYDFVPGEKVVFFEDFSTDAIGDFPARWNTNISGEVVGIKSHPEKWLKLNTGGGFIPEGLPALPDNFTLEFDMLLAQAETGNDPWLQLDIYGGAVNNKLDDLYPGESGTNFKISTLRIGVENKAGDNHGGISSWVDKPIISNNKGKPVRVSLWRQKERIRLYLNETKVYDLPRLLPSGVTYNLVRFFTWDNGMNEEDRLYIANIRVAVGAPDMRNKLLTEGKLVTHGILFDVNADKIKPASAGTLKEIATILQENPAIKVKIVGHTDHDGDEAANLALSTRRAAAVKDALSKTYGINAARMETGGMGESQPIADNSTPEGKAANRRVEFLKL